MLPKYFLNKTVGNLQYKNQTNERPHDKAQPLKAVFANLYSIKKKGK